MVFAGRLPPDEAHPLDILFDIKPFLSYSVYCHEYGGKPMKLAKAYPTVLTVHTLVDIDSRNRSKSIKASIHDAIWKKLE